MTSATEPARPSPTRRGRRLQVDFLSALVALLVVTVGASSAWNCRTGVRTLHKLADALMDGASETAFRKYVPASLVRQLVDSGEEAKLGGARREITLFFSDIEGFTSLSEVLEPEALLAHVSEYLDELTRILMEGRGTVDKYIGDAIMAFWGAPLAEEEHALLACRAALRCQARLDVLNARWAAEGKVPLPTRIGIGTGEVVVGNLGSSERLNYTAIGDTVNLASRLEGANKQYGTRILVSEATATRVAPAMHLRPVDVVAVKGKNRAVRVYELLAERGPGDEPLADRVVRSTAAFDLYVARRWSEAAEAWTRLAAETPDDPVAARFVERIAPLAAQPPAEGWDGVARLDEK